MGVKYQNEFLFMLSSFLLSSKVGGYKDAFHVFYAVEQEGVVHCYCVLCGLVLNCLFVVVES